MGISLAQAISNVKNSGKSVVPNTFLGSDVKVIEVYEALNILSIVDSVKEVKPVEVDPWFDEYVKSFERVINSWLKMRIVKNITQIGYGHTLEGVNDKTYKPDSDKHHEELSEYHDEVINNREKYVRAILDGYTVKKEPVYLMPVPYQDNVKMYYHKKEDRIVTVYPSNRKHTGFHFTEAEIKKHFPLISDLKEEYKDE